MFVLKLYIGVGGGVGVGLWLWYIAGGDQAYPVIPN